MSAREDLEALGVPADAIMGLITEELNRAGAVQNAIERRRAADPNFAARENDVARWLGNSPDTQAHLARLAGHPETADIAIQWLDGRYLAEHPGAGHSQEPAPPSSYGQQPPPGRDASSAVMGGGEQELLGNSFWKPVALTERDRERQARDAYVKMRLRQSIVLPP